MYKIHPAVEKLCPISIPQVPPGPLTTDSEWKWHTSSMISELCIKRTQKSIVWAGNTFEI